MKLFYKFANIIDWIFIAVCAITFITTSFNLVPIDTLHSIGDRWCVSIILMIVLCQSLTEKFKEIK